MKKYYARKCEVKEISPDVAQSFLNENHLQKFRKSSVYLGLFFGEELLQVESFGRPYISRSSKYQWELYRECSKKDCYVVGGKSKLLRFFIDKYSAVSIVSYCNKELGFDGHSYIACGFKEVRTTLGYHYEKDGEIISRYRMQKGNTLEGTIKKYGGVYDSNLTERQNAANNGFEYVREKEGQITFELMLPYVYKVTDRSNGKSYIGSKTSDSNHCHMIGVNYFTSSTDKDFRTRFESNPHDFDIEIVYIGKNKKEVIEKEAKLIQSNNLDYNRAYYNRGHLVCRYDDEWRKSHIGKRPSVDTKQKISSTLKEYYKSNPNPFLGLNHTDEAKEKISLKNKGRKHTEEEKKRVSETLKGHIGWNQSAFTPEKNKKRHDAQLEKQKERVCKLLSIYPVYFPNNTERFWLYLGFSKQQLSVLKDLELIK